VGCATVVADFAGLGGMVDTGNMQRMRRLNFGVRTLQGAAISKDGVLSALGAYNPANARQVTEWIRSEVDLSAAVDRLLTTYDLAMNALPSAEQDLQARTSLADASAYLRGLAPVIKTRSEAEMRALRAEDALRVAESCRVQLTGELALATTHVGEVRAQLERSDQQNSALSGELARLQRDLQILHGSPAWRAISRYRRLRARP